MELTTPQIVATAIILAFVAIVAGISYWAGYTSGKSCEFEHGRITARMDQQAERLQLEGDLAEARRLLECRNRELQALRTNIEIEADDHAEVVRDLHRRLANTTTLTAEDRAILQAIVAKLNLAADTWAGLRVNDHAITARAYAEYATELAARAGLEQQAHPDTELIEWLDREASFHADHETAELRFMVCTRPEGHAHIRDVIRLGMHQAEEIEQNHQDTLEACA